MSSSSPHPSHLEIAHHRPPSSRLQGLRQRRQRRRLNQAPQYDQSLGPMRPAASGRGSKADAEAEARDMALRATEPGDQRRERECAASTMQSVEMVMWFSGMRNESFTQTKNHFLSLVSSRSGTSRSASSSSPTTTTTTPTAAKSTVLPPHAHPYISRIWKEEYEIRHSEKVNISRLGGKGGNGKEADDSSNDEDSEQDSEDEEEGSEEGEEDDEDDDEQTSEEEDEDEEDSEEEDEDDEDSEEENSEDEDEDNSDVSSK